MIPQPPTRNRHVSGVVINLSLGVKNGPSRSADVNIGVGELQEPTLPRSIDI